MTDQQHRTPTLSIQPNPKYYVPTRGHLFERLKSMINASEGGVYGVTGVRGAGKSILLESIARHYRKANHHEGKGNGKEKRNHTLVIPAPVSSNRDMEFFVMLFTQLCESVVRDLRGRVFGKHGDVIALAKEDLRTRRLVFASALFMLLAIVFQVCNYSYYFQSFQDEQELIGDPLIRLRALPAEAVTRFTFEAGRAHDAIVSRLTADTATRAVEDSDMRGKLEEAKKNLQGTIDKLDFARWLQEMEVAVSRELFMLRKFGADIPHPALILFVEFGRGKFQLEKDFLYRHKYDADLLKKNDIIGAMDKILERLRSGIGVLSISPVDRSSMLKEISNDGKASFNQAAKSLRDATTSLQQDLKKNEVWVSRLEGELAATVAQNGESKKLDEEREKLEEVVKNIESMGTLVRDNLNPIVAQAESLRFEWSKIETWTKLPLPADEIDWTERLDGVSKSWGDFVAYLSGIEYLKRTAAATPVQTAPMEDPIGGFDIAFQKEIENLARIGNQGNFRQWRKAWLATLVFASIIIFTFALVLITWRSGRSWIEGRRHKAELGLLRKSEDMLRTLEYVVTRSQSASIKAPLIEKITASLSASRQETRRPLTLPGLTAYYREYIENVRKVFLNLGSNRKLIICIDELDKIGDSQEIANILREIKGALNVSDCYYLLSISEDAVRAFESRLVDERDIFESTFDEILVVERLDLDCCRSIADKRFEGTKFRFEGPEQELERSIVVAGVLSAGVPRELIRNLREVIGHAEHTSRLTANDAWQVLFTRKVGDLLGKVRSTTGAEEIRTELIFELENVLASGDWDLQSVEVALVAMEDRVRELKARSDTVKSILSGKTPERARFEHELRILQDWQRYWTELRIYFLVQRVSLTFVTFDDRKPLMEMLLQAYAMLPYSADVCSRKLDGLYEWQAAVKSPIEEELIPDPA